MLDFPGRVLALDQPSLPSFSSSYIYISAIISLLEKQQSKFVPIRIRNC